MNGRNEILDELRSLSPVIAGIGHETPYVVPEGYFERFPVEVLGRVASKSLNYSVPEGYFEGFAQGVLARIKSGANELDPVSEVLARIGRITPYQAPEDYFEELSPLLTVARDKHPYAVPEGYFESFAELVAVRTAAPVMRKGIVRRMGWMKYSVAAVLAGLIFTVGWLRWQHSGSPASHPTVDVATLSKFSDTELQNFLTDQDTTLAQPLSNTSAAIDMSDTDLKTLLGDVPDGELKQYMEEHGGASDIATN